MDPSSERVTSSSEWTPKLRQQLAEAAQAAGFDEVGVAPVDAVASETEGRDAERFEQWIDLGRAGEMDYLKRRDEAGKLLRTSVQVPMPWARSVVLCAFNYNAPHPTSIEPAPKTSGWIARYAWSGTPATDAEPALLAPADYHDELLRRLRSLEIELGQHGQTRCYVDTGPMVERTLAARAGLGWIGKNTCVLNQQLGSWLLLGAIVTSLHLPPPLQPELAADRCGSCTRCLDACPTGALVAPREMDAARCIAYLTIEKKGGIPEPLREPMGRQVFGCDICQDVCPWNHRAPFSQDATFRARPELVNPPLAWLAGMNAAEFRKTFRGSPLERTGRKRLHRNVAVAMGNSGDPQFRPTLQAWRAAEDDPVLAATADWALSRLPAETPAPADPVPELRSTQPDASRIPHDPLC